MGSGVAMENADDSSLACLGDHRACVVFSIASVHHNRPSGFPGEKELLGECAALLLPWRVVVMVVETAFAHRYCTSRHFLPQCRYVPGVVESRGVMRMNARGMPDEPCMLSCYRT